MFLDPRPAFGRSVDRDSPTKPGAMQILQYGPTGFRTLENADDQNAIVLLRPKSHTNFYKCYRLANIDAIQLRLPGTDALRSVGIGMARSNLISKVFAYTKFFVAHTVRLSAPTIITKNAANRARTRPLGRSTVGKEATEWPPDTNSVI